MADFDIQIKGGTVVDGTRVPRYRADVWIKEGRIAQIGGRAPGFAKKVIDADGLIVAPGFVDLHTHYDAQIRWDPYCTISGWHGVTSVVLGNCGFGFAPVKPDFRERSMLTMTRTEAIPYDSMKHGLNWDWETIPEYLDSLDRAPKGVNCIQYMPTASLMTYVMGLEAAKTRPATEDERAEMRRLLHKGWTPDCAAFPSSAWARTPDRPILTARRWSPTPCAMRTSSTWRGCCASATKASSRSPRQPATSRKTWRSWNKWRTKRAGRCCTMRSSRREDPGTHREPAAGWRGCAPRVCRSSASAGTHRTGFGFTLEHWNLYDSSRRGAR